MDPNTALTRIRQLIQEDDRSELAHVVTGLDHWISTGGLVPDAWKEKDPVFPQLRVPLRKEPEEKEVD